MNQTIDIEATPTNVPRDNQALMIRPAQEVGLFGTSEPIAVIEKATSVADALKQVIVKQGLVSKISGKEYPRCEAWTLLGTMLGVFPVTVWTKELENGWEARVEARTKDGAIVGAAEAECLRSEKNWQNRDDFALRSMAQTRATAKCLRMPLGFVMTLAGFEATPAEEMNSEIPPKNAAPMTSTERFSKAANTRAPTAPQRTSPATRPAQPAVFADDDTRNRLISQLKDCSKLATEYFQKVGCLMDNEGLEDLPLRFVPVTRRQFQALQSALAGFGNGEEATGLPYPPNPEAEPAAPPAKPAETKTAKVEEEWRVFPMPWGKQAGVVLGKLDKKYLFGLWANFEVEREYKGKSKKPEAIAKDETFRAMLDLAGKHYEFTKGKDTGGDDSATGVPGDPEQEDDVPF